MNNITVMGRLARDPKYNVSHSERGDKEVANFALVVKRNSSSETFLLPVVAFGGRAKLVNEHLKQGTKIMISGELYIAAYEDKVTKQKKYYTEVIMGSMEFAQPKGDAAIKTPDGFEPIDIPEGIDSGLPFA